MTPISGAVTLRRCLRYEAIAAGIICVLMITSGAKRRIAGSRRRIRRIQHHFITTSRASTPLPARLSTSYANDEYSIENNIRSDAYFAERVEGTPNPAAIFEISCRTSSTAGGGP